MPTFKDLRIWQEAFDLMLKIHNICLTLPREERFNLRSQIERSSSSVADNISEGYASYYYNDKIKSLYIARKEAAETQNHILKAEGKKYLNSTESKTLVTRYEGLIKGINSFINYISDKRNKDKNNRSFKSRP